MGERKKILKQNPVSRGAHRVRGEKLKKHLEVMNKKH
jgi:hypothetical protein